MRELWQQFVVLLPLSSWPSSSLPLWSLWPSVLLRLLSSWTVSLSPLASLNFCRRSSFVVVVGRRRCCVVASLRLVGGKEWQVVRIVVAWLCSLGDDSTVPGEKRQRRTHLTCSKILSRHFLLWCDCFISVHKLTHQVQLCARSAQP